MDIAVLLLVSITFITASIHFILYLRNTKTFKEIDKEHTELIIKHLEEIQESTKDLKSDLKTTALNTLRSFDELRKEVKISQDQSNSKMNSGFLKLEDENKNIRKEALISTDNIQTAFKEYAKRVDALLNNYSTDNAERQKETNQLKHQIQQELQLILREIKAPLDLD